MMAGRGDVDQCDWALRTATTTRADSAGTMMAAPMLADFAVRLAFGLSIATVLVPWRAVPLPFFRTQAQIILGLLVLAALDQARASGTGIRILDDRARRSAGICLIDRVGAGAAGPGSQDGRALTAIAAMVWLTAASAQPATGSCWRSTPRAGRLRVFCWGRCSARCFWAITT